MILSEICSETVADIDELSLAVVSASSVAEAIATCVTYRCCETLFSRRTCQLDARFRSDKAIIFSIRSDTVVVL